MQIKEKFINNPEKKTPNSQSIKFIILSLNNNKIITEIWIHTKGSWTFDF